MQIFDTDVFLICRSKQEGIPNLCVHSLQQQFYIIWQMYCYVPDVCIFLSYYVTFV